MGRLRVKFSRKVINKSRHHPVQSCLAVCHFQHAFFYRHLSFSPFFKNPTNLKVPIRQNGKWIVCNQWIWLILTFFSLLMSPATSHPSSHLGRVSRHHPDGGKWSHRVPRVGMSDRTDCHFRCDNDMGRGISHQFWRPRRSERLQRATTTCKGC